MAVQSKAWVCSALITGNAGSYPAECIDVGFLGLLCVESVAASAAGSFVQRNPTGCVCVCVSNCELSIDLTKRGRIIGL